MQCLLGAAVFGNQADGRCWAAACLLTSCGRAVVFVWCSKKPLLRAWLAASLSFGSCPALCPVCLQPWQRKRQYSSSGSGFVIEGRRLLTNAHWCAVAWHRS